MQVANLSQQVSRACYNLDARLSHLPGASTSDGAIIITQHSHQISASSFGCDFCYIILEAFESINPSNKNLEQERITLILRPSGEVQFWGRENTIFELYAPNMGG
jgi:hypothetical protein